MFTTIDEGLAVYSRELAAFKDWIDQVEKVYARGRRGVWSFEEWLPWGPKSEPHGWPSAEFEKTAYWRKKLKGMEAALGMTGNEVRQKFQAAGISVEEAMKWQPNRAQY